MLTVRSYIAGERTRLSAKILFITKIYLEQGLFYVTISSAIAGVSSSKVLDAHCLECAIS